MATDSDIDHADDRSKRLASKRRIKLPGRAEVYDSTNPNDIARELRGKSKLGERERKLANS